MTRDRHDLPTLVRRETKMREQVVSACPPLFATRVLQFVCKRRKRATEQRPKSWPGRAESVRLPASATSCRQASTSSTASTSFSCSVLCTQETAAQLQLDQTPVQEVAGSRSSAAQWRQRQTHCANCERLFFTSLSSLRNGAGRFCSLDCKTNLEYMHQLQKVTCTQTWVSSADCSVEVGDKEVAQQTTSLEGSGLDHHVGSRAQAGRHCRAFAHHRVH